jgi:aminopeptidase
LGTDEGARYLGEVALVPYSSPIRKSGILFYNTLFDENASCHFAVGRAYPCIENAGKMTEEELLKSGINTSLTHVDFMIGTKDLTITAVTADGKTLSVFEAGEWVL